MNRQDIVMLYDYNAWANARILRAVEPLIPEAFLRDLKNSFPSVRDTLAHILGAEWIWLRRWASAACGWLSSSGNWRRARWCRCAIRSSKA